MTWARIHALAETLRARLSEIPGVTVRDIGAERCGIVSARRHRHLNSRYATSVPVFRLPPGEIERRQDAVRAELEDLRVLLDRMLPALYRNGSKGFHEC